MKLTALALFFLTLPITALVAHPQWAETARRLQEFYAEPFDAAKMNEAVPKYSVKTQQRVYPNSFLRLKDTTTQPTDALTQLAQVKATEKFQKAECQQFFNKKIPALACARLQPTDAKVEANDKIEDLTQGWIKKQDLVTDLDSVPTKGETELPIWSDDYWRTQRGGTSYRYAIDEKFDNYKKAIASYAQPKAWQALHESGEPKIETKIRDWSPAEKYDLTVGDKKFNLTNEQKSEGQNNLGADGNVEDWVGICDGWSSAAIMTPKPKRAVTVIGTDSVGVTWYPSDIKAMASLAWAKGETSVNFISGRCDAKKPATYPNGRLKQQECFDTNPATFHLALANLIGIQKKSFIMDATFDYEVWNQPLKSYDFKYFNPLDPTKTGIDWRKMAIPYDAKFKAKDRFQVPLTRGTRKGEKYNDKRVKKIVGVVATVVYFSELDPPKHTAVVEEDELDDVSYIYDLELSEIDGQLVPTGGEWHQNAHPDFLWLPKVGVTAHTKSDATELDFDGKSEPTKLIIKTAASASEGGYPLCEVLSTLVKKSSDGKYRCQK